MKLGTDIREEPEINLTSLIDVVFLLLIFFMVTTTFERQAALKVALPEADATVENAEPERMILTIDAQGRMYLDDQALVDNSKATLVAALQGARSDNGDRPVVIRADADAAHRHVVRAMDALGEAGVTDFSIATVEPEAE